MENTATTSLGGLRPAVTGKEGSSVVELGGKRDDTLIIVGEAMQSLGSSVYVGGELAFLKMASDLHLAASVSPLMLANFDFVLDSPMVSPFFDKVAASVMRSIAQDMGIEVTTVKVDRQMFRLTMRLRCIPWQVKLLEHRYPEAKVTLVLDEPAVDETTTGEAGQTSAESR